MKTALELIIAGGAVRRFHTIPMVTEHTVGQHSFRVVSLLVLLANEGVEHADSKNLLIHALWHDIAEARVGDVPAPVKRSSQAVKEHFDKLEGDALWWADIKLPELTAEEHGLLKLADCLDGVISCVHERRLGNNHIDLHAVVSRFLNYIEDLKPEGPQERLVNHVLDMWVEANDK